MSDEFDIIEALNTSNGSFILPSESTEIGEPSSDYTEASESADLVNSFTDFPPLPFGDLTTTNQPRVSQQATENTYHTEVAENPESTGVNEDELARLLSEYVAGPAPGPVMGTFDGEPIELTEENKAWMSEAAAQAGLGLTVKGKRKQHYMTFELPTDGTLTVYIANTPPETPPREPSPAPTPATLPAALPAAIPAALPARNTSHTGAGIRKRPHKCAHCMSTFSSVARLTAHIQKTHADKLASAAAPVADQTSQN